MILIKVALADFILLSGQLVNCFEFAKISYLLTSLSIYLTLLKSSTYIDCVIVSTHSQLTKGKYLCKRSFVDFSTDFKMFGHRYVQCVQGINYCK